MVLPCTSTTTGVVVGTPAVGVGTSGCAPAVAVRPAGTGVVPGALVPWPALAPVVSTATSPDGRIWAKRIRTTAATTTTPTTASTNFLLMPRSPPYSSRSRASLANLVDREAHISTIERPDLGAIV